MARDWCISDLTMMTMMNNRSEGRGEKENLLFFRCCFKVMDEKMVWGPTKRLFIRGRQKGLVNGMVELVVDRPSLQANGPSS